MPRLDPLTPVGARLSDVRVGALDQRSVNELRRLLAEHGVLILPGLDVGDGEFLRFLKSFGRTAFTVGETPLPGFPELNIITNVGRERPPRSTFHTDTSYIRNPPAYTALRAVKVPRRGGHTVFSNQYAAYASLPARLRDELNGRTITHVMTGLELGDDAETSVAHPIFRVHPISGRPYLFLSTPARCAAVSGMPAKRAAETIAFLFQHSTREDNVYRHTWSPGDVVMWDNRCVMHRADHSGVVGDRVMHRGMVAGDG